MMFTASSLSRINKTNFNTQVERAKFMTSFKWKRFMGLGLSLFALFFGSVGLTGCEDAGDGDAEELGEDIDQGAEDLKEKAE